MAFEFCKTRAESFHPRKLGVRGGSNNAGGSGSVGDSYLSMDLKIHEDVQGNVFVKASPPLMINVAPTALGTIAIHHDSVSE